MPGIEGSFGGVRRQRPPAAHGRGGKQFLTDVDTTLKRLGIAAAQAGWVGQNFITADTEALDARATQQAIEAIARFAKEAVRFNGVELPPDERRQLDLLKLSLVMVTPSEPGEPKS